MEHQRRDEFRAAAVREDGTESWDETNQPTDGMTNGQPATESPSHEPGDSVHQVESASPGGGDFSSSAAPAGVGSNTPVGAEPDSFRAWDDGVVAQIDSSRPRSPQAVLARLVTFVTIGSLAYAWWRRRRQARQTRTARLRAALGAARAPWGAPARRRMPQLIGRAKTRSLAFRLVWTLMRAGLWPLARRKAGGWVRTQAARPVGLGMHLIQTQGLGSCSQQLARQGSGLLRDARQRFDWQAIRAAGQRRGWVPWLVGGAAVGGAFLAYRAYRSGRLCAARPGTLAESDSATLVRDVMTRGVETVAPDTTVAEVARRMRDLDVGSLPVCDGSRLVGIVTDRDLTIRATAGGTDPNATPVRDVMSPETAWIFDDVPAATAARTMRERQVRRLPVLDRSDRLIGVVALGDLATDLGDDRLKGETLEEISQPSGGGHQE